MTVLNSALLFAGLATAAVADQRVASLGGQPRSAWLFLLPLLPLQAVALHGAEFNELLRGTPHEIVSFAGAPSPGSTAPPPRRLDLTVSTHGHDLIVALEKHNTLFADKYEHIIMHANGSVASRVPRGDHCIYRGRLFHAHDEARTSEVGDALLSVCSGRVEGSLRIGDTHTLAVAPHPAGGGAHAVFRHHHWGESTKSEEWTCGVDDGEHTAAPHSHAVGHATHEHERDAAPRHDAAGHATHERRRLVNGNVNKYVELIVVNDYARCQAYVNDGKTLSEMATRSAGIVAVVDGLYKGGYTGSPYFSCVFPLLSAPLLCPPALPHRVHRVRLHTVLRSTLRRFIARALLRAATISRCHSSPRSRSRTAIRTRQPRRLATPQRSTSIRCWRSLKCGASRPRRAVR